MRTLALSLLLVSVLSACTMPGAKTPAESATGMVETTTGVTVEVTPTVETTVSAEATTATGATVEVTPTVETTVSTGTAQ